jgi:hypothetical protein
MKDQRDKSDALRIPTTTLFLNGLRGGEVELAGSTILS